MVHLVVVFTLATIVLSLSVTHIMGTVEGHEELLGLPAGSTAVPVIIGMVMVLVAAGTLLAPFAVVMKARSTRRPRRSRLRR